MGRSSSVGFLSGAAVLLAAVSTSLAAPGSKPTTQPAPANAIAILARPTPAYAEGKWQGYGSLLIREMGRQAMVIAADRAGVPAIDVVLTPQYPQPPANRLLDVLAIQRFNSPLSVTVQLGIQQLDSTAKMYDWHGTSIPPYDQLAASLAPRIDHEYAAVLRRFGGNAAARTQGKASVPPQAEWSLQSFDLFNAFHAAHLTHAAIAGDGVESPARLSALVRAYAILGEESRPLVSAHRDVFFARSLLYAQRLLDARPNEPASYWARAFAESLIGLDELARDDLKRANELRRSSTGLTTTVPYWVEAIDAFLASDRTKLGPLSMRRDVGALATHLSMRLIEFSGVDAEAIAAAGNAWNADPMNTRAYFVGFERGALGDRRIAVTVLPDVLDHGFDSLMRWSELPPPLHRGLADARAHHLSTESKLRLWATLDAQADTGPLPWSTLTSLAREMSLVMAQREASYLVNDVGVDCDAEVRRWWPLIRAHPCSTIVGSYSTSGDRDGLKRFTFDDASSAFRPFAVQLLRQSVQLHPSGITWEAFINQHWDATSWEAAEGLSHQMVRQDAQEVLWHAKPLLFHRPDDALGLAALVQADWPSVAGRQAELEDRAKSNATLVSALARHYDQVGDYVSARRVLEDANERWDDGGVAFMLADEYQRANDVEHVIDTLARYIDRSQDHGLATAVANERIAKLLLSHGDAVRALPYATAAAESGSSWGYEVQAETLARLGRFDEAYQVLATETERYAPHSTFLSYLLGQVYDHPPGGTLTDDFRAKASAYVNSPFDGERTAAALVELAEGRGPNALIKEMERESRDTSSTTGQCILLAALRLQAGQRPAALEALKLAIDAPGSTPTINRHRICATLARDLLTGKQPGPPPTPEEQLNLSYGSMSDSPAITNDALLMGAVCEATDHVDIATKWYRFAIQQPSSAGGRLVAVRQLIAIGIEPWATPH